MDKVIVTGLLVIGSVTAALVVILALLPVIGSSSSAVIKSQSEAANRIKTSIEVIAVSGTGDQIRAWVKNVGTASIVAIDRSDVFLIRTTDPNIRFDSMTYNADPAGSPSDNKTWTGDRKESSLPWDRGDTLQILIELPTDTLRTGDHVLRFSTPNGTTAEKTFEKPGS